MVAQGMSVSRRYVRSISNEGMSLKAELKEENVEFFFLTLKAELNEREQALVY